MLSPQDLYKTYSQQPCENIYYGSDPLKGDISNGQGTPWYSRRLVQFLKHVKYPCIHDTPGFSGIRDTGKNKIGLPFKFLQMLDAEAYVEIQPSIKSGTSHSVRNACDLARACMFAASGTENLWHHRMAAEYIEHFGSNSLPDCLMTLGPDLVPNIVAHNGRAPSTASTIPNTYKGMLCLPGDGKGVAGAFRSCMTPPSPIGNPPPQCRSCPFCDEDLAPGQESNNPCCKYSIGSVEYNNLCCGAPITSRLDFAYLIPQEDVTNLNLRPNKTVYLADIDNFDVLNSFESNSITLTSDRIGQIEDLLDDLDSKDALSFKDNSIWIYNGGNNKKDQKSYVRYDYKLRHVGILERKLYGGYANLIDNSGSNFYAIMDDVFLEHFQGINGWDYQNDTLSDTPSANNILRARTISLVIEASITEGRSPETDTQKMVDHIKDLLWNGYGVILFSNIGFPNTMDSQGISYPDRIWYNTYTIIGYDDTKLEFDECVYVLSCPWGKWISGGNPSWGPLPDGCFLVTETHLKCMLQYYPDREFFDCRNQLPCNPAIDDCEDPDVLKRLAGCGGHGPEEKCEPYRCNKQQRAIGTVLAISLSDGFPKQTLDHSKFYPVIRFKELIQEKTMYYQYNND